jgi:uncharacterized membrane protein YsdA (DUF1294 family)
MEKVIIYYLAAINLYGLITMYVDKKRAETHKWRVPESRIFLIAALFGSIGVLAGMRMFRHKTKHKKFVYGIPLILVLQIILAFYLVQYIRK